MKPCTRFRHDGSACTNQTESADGWCRADDCPGFLRADPTQAPITQGSFQGTAEHIRRTGHLPSGEVTVEDVATIRVTKHAIDTFRLHHGGSKREAEVQLRGMLEDFLLKSARSVTRNERLKLTREGFGLILSPDRDMVIGYFTVHRERTWEQVKAGVKSRFKKLNAREASGPAPESGPPIDLPDFDAAFDPQNVHLTARVRTSYTKIAGLQDVSDDELDAAIRAACVDFTSAGVCQREDGCFEINQPGRIWLISPDCRSLYGVKASATSLGPPKSDDALDFSDGEAAAPNRSRRDAHGQVSPGMVRKGRSGPDHSKATRLKGRKGKAQKSKSKDKSRNELHEYWDNERAKDERIDHRTKSPYLGIYSVKSVTSAGLPGHGKRR